MRSLLGEGDKRPLYERLKERLTAELRDFSIGGKFYADRELIRKYGVSPHVVRQALSLLVQEGYIERKVSKGTFVKAWERDAPPVATRRVAVFCPLTADQTFPHIAAAKGITEILDEVEYAPEIHNNYQTPESMETLILSKLHKTDGAIWISPTAEEIFEMPATLHAHSNRLVFVNINIHDPGFTCVNRDDVSAVFALTSRLARQGRKKFAFIGGPEERLISRERYVGYAQALNAKGLRLDPARVVSCERLDDISSGFQAMETILRESEAPDAVICLTDYLAVGAINCLTARGLSVPAAVAVTGFDNNKFVQTHLYSELTSAEDPFCEQGRQASHLLLAQLLKKQSPGIRQMVPCALFFRGSTGQQPSVNAQATEKEGSQ